MGEIVQKELKICPKNVYAAQKCGHLGHLNKLLWK